MSSSLSDDEFVRLQTQLLELRTANYQHAETVGKQEREIKGLRDEVETLTKELTKANKTIGKSKKAKEVEQLVQENESFQRKLLSQEEEFRLQNETIMTELQQLVGTNEKLEKECESLKSTKGSSSSSDGALTDEARRLQAHNSALQKTLTATQERHDNEVIRLRETISDLEAQCLKLSGQRGTPVGEGSDCRFIEGQSTDADLEEGDLCHGDLSTPPSGATKDESEVDGGTSVHAENMTTQEKLDSLNKQLTELRLSADIEKEEKTMLQEQLQTTEKTLKDEIHSLQSELEKVREKFKKKQESLVQLQEEKEKLYSELSGKIENLHIEKTSQIQTLEQQSGRLQSELSSTSHAMAEYENKSQAHIQQLENFIQNLESRVDESSQETVQQLALANEELNSQIEHLNREIVMSRDMLLGAQNKIESLNALIAENDKIHSSTLEDLSSLQAERDLEAIKTQEASTLAEKRKNLLDELAIKYQEETDDNRRIVRELTSKHQKEAEELSAHIDELQGKLKDFDKTKEALERVKAELHSAETAKSWLERRLNESEENLKKLKEEGEEELNKTIGECDQSIASLQAEHDEEVQKLREEIESVQEEKVGLEERISKLKQDIKDGVADKRIHEKKGSTIIKDLKRQLHSERKRADKLQERLQELLADSKSRQSVDELFRPSDPNDRIRGDTSSLSSWGAHASGLSLDLSATSPEDEVSSPGSDLQQENSDLLRRIGRLQEEHWTMEEKVSHLESSNASMADDLLMKTAIIQHYVMESKHDHKTSSPSNDKITLKRVVDFVNNKGDENLREINRKLQRIVEETLTKNMHLQQDMETLSQEIVRLSKQGVQGAASASPGKG